MAGLQAIREEAAISTEVEGRASWEVLQAAQQSQRAAKRERERGEGGRGGEEGGGEREWGCERKNAEDEEPAQIIPELPPPSSPPTRCI
jgi:hypothetical protein